MWIAHLIILSLFVGLAILFLFTRVQPTPSIRSWPQLPLVPKDLIPVTLCQANTDCQPGHVCLGNTCVPKLLRGGKCDLANGRWISYRLKNATFAVCSCLDETLYAQRIFGGNCNTNVACGAHGQYDPVQKTCECEPGFKPAFGLTCQKLTAAEYKNLLPCDPDEFEVTATNLVGEGFHADYVIRLQSFKCVKRPCSFDALNGRPLKHARYAKDWGCVCDPRYGLFGVMLEGHQKNYLKSKGFDACASVFTHDPNHPMNVEVITYFYLGEREPISMIVFDGLKDNFLIPLLKYKKGRFIVTQSAWRYDYAQRFFVKKGSFRARTRSAHDYYQYTWSVSTTEYDYKNNFSPVPCSHLYDIIRHSALILMQPTYKALYSSPVCKVGRDDVHAHPIFRDRVVLNPIQVTLDKHEHLPRFNAFVLKYEAHVFQRWTLDLDYAHDIDVYLKFPTNAPNYLGNPPVFS